jgi:hypothetical protein
MIWAESRIAEKYAGKIQKICKGNPEKCAREFQKYVPETFRKMCQRRPEKCVSKPCHVPQTDNCMTDHSGHWAPVWKGDRF